MQKMEFLIKKENDNSNFILNLESIILNRINLWKPTDIFVTRIDNWFDEKWLDFSGTIMHEISVWEGETTIPPFHPNRVENSDFYQKGTEQYVKKENLKTLHIYQESKNNLKRKLTEFTNNGLFIWYSGNSKKNNIGTFMCYLVKEQECFSFHLSMNGEKEWNVIKTKGISLKEMQIIVENNKTKI